MTPEELFAENQRLVTFTYNKHFSHHTLSESWKQDLFQEGFIALWIACNKYNEELNTTFSTFACACIYRRMLRYIQYKINRHASTLSLEEISMIEDSNYFKSPSESFHSSLEITDLIDYTLKRCRNQKVSDVVSLVLKGFKQNEVSEMLNISQGQVSRLWQIFKEKFREIYKEVK